MTILHRTEALPNSFITISAEPIFPTSPDPPRGPSKPQTWAGSRISSLPDSLSTIGVFWSLFPPTERLQALGSTAADPLCPASVGNRPNGHTAKMAGAPFTGITPVFASSSLLPWLSIPKAEGNRASLHSWVRFLS